MRDELENWCINLNDYILSTAFVIGVNATLVATSGGEVYVVSNQNGEIINQQRVFKNGTIAAKTAPNGDFLLITSDEGTVKLLNCIDFTVVFEDTSFKGWIEQIAWSPDGYYVAYAAGRNVNVLNGAGDKVFQSQAHPSTVGALCWNVDNSYLVSAYFGGISIFDIEKKAIKQQMTWPTAVVSLSWSPDGTFICGGTQDSKVHFWSMPYEAESDFEMSGYKGKVTLPRWSYDGHFLATNCWNELIIWKVAGRVPTGQEPLILVGHEGRITAMNFHPTAHLLVTGSNRGEVILWDPKFSKKMIASFLYNSEITCISWLSDGSAFIVATKEGEVSMMESPV